MSVSNRQRLASESWTAFCERLKQAGEHLLRDDFPIEDIDLAEGLRYLVHLVYASIHRNFVAPIPRSRSFICCAMSASRAGVTIRITATMSPPSARRMNIS